MSIPSWAKGVGAAVGVAITVAGGGLAGHAGGQGATEEKVKELDGRLRKVEQGQAALAGRVGELIRQQERLQEAVKDGQDQQEETLRSIHEELRRLNR